MTAAANSNLSDRDDHIPIEQLMAEQGIQPIGSVAELADPNAFESDEEVEEFLADLYASRSGQRWMPRSAFR